MLGTKVLMLSLIGVLCLHQQFGPAKWIAVLFCTTATFLLSWSGKRIERRFVILGLLACLSYCLSDISIQSLVRHFSFMGSVSGASLATTLCYILCGGVGAVIVLVEPKHSTRGTWLYALPFSVSWFIAMLCLFSCFGLVGVIYGNILQSIRGIISIILGFALAHIGFETLEPKPSIRIIIQRFVAAVLMTAAVALFLT